MSTITHLYISGTVYIWAKFVCALSYICTYLQMGTNTISLDDEAYELLEAEKREDESFSDTIKRVVSEVATDWDHSIGKYSGEQADEFEDAVHKSSEATNQGIAHRQREVADLLDGGSASLDTDE